MRSLATSFLMVLALTTSAAADPTPPAPAAAPAKATPATTTATAKPTAKKAAAQQPATQKPAAPKPAAAQPAVAPGPGLGAMAAAAAQATRPTPPTGPQPLRPLDLSPRRQLDRAADARGHERGSGIGLGDDTSWKVQALQVGGMAALFGALVGLCGSGNCRLPGDVFPTVSEGPSGSLDTHERDNSARPAR
jgi:hypothetical protein